MAGGVSGTSAPAPGTRVAPTTTEAVQRQGTLSKFFDPADNPGLFTVTGLVGGAAIGSALGVLAGRNSTTVTAAAARGGMVGALAGAATLGLIGLIAWSVKHGDNTPVYYDPGPPIIYEPYYDPPVIYEPYYDPYPDYGYDPGYDPGYSYDPPTSGGDDSSHYGNPDFE